MILTMEFEKNYMQMEEQGIESYLEKMVSDFARQNSRNSRLKFWAQLGKNFKWYLIFEIFTIYRKNFRFLKIFTPFLLFWTVFYPFGSFLTNMMM